MIGAKYHPREVAFAALLISLASSSLASSARGASFHMIDGTVVEGDIIDKMAGNAIIRSAIGYAVNSHTSGIDSISFRLQDGTEINGTLVDWQDNVYIIRYDGKDAIVEVQLTSDRGYLVRSVKSGQPVPAASPTIVEPSPPAVSAVDNPSPPSLPSPTPINAPPSKPVM